MARWLPVLMAELSRSASGGQQYGDISGESILDCRGFFACSGSVGAANGPTFLQDMDYFHRKPSGLLGGSLNMRINKAVLSIVTGRGLAAFAPSSAFANVVYAITVDTSSESS